VTPQPVVGQASELIGLRDPPWSQLGVRGFGTVGPVVDRTFPLEEVPAAIRYLREGGACGKVVIAI